MERWFALILMIKYDFLLIIVKVLMKLLLMLVPL